MKKVYVGVLATHGETYDAFKKVWLRNIEHTHKLDCEVKFEFCFIYGGEVTQIVHNDLYTDLYYEYPETLPNMLRKTLRFFEHVEKLERTNRSRGEVFVLRTNLSTLFDFQMYQEWLKDIPSRVFFGGSLIDGVHGKATCFSGTNMIMSFDVMRFVVVHQDRFSYDYNEDIELSSIVMMNIMCTLKSMKRLDFLGDKMVYHKCNMFSEKVCCYRFKSSNRRQDVSNMHNILACLQAGVNVTRFIQLQMKHLVVTAEASGMSRLSEQTWMLNPN
jgi:hypothetical protein